MVAQPIRTFNAETCDHLAAVFGVVLKCRAAAALGSPKSTSARLHRLSTFGRQRRILVGVHSVLRESAVFGDFRVPGQVRMDNLPKAHT